jgi:hypothetical protein
MSRAKQSFFSGHKNAENTPNSHQRQACSLLRKTLQTRIGASGYSRLLISNAGQLIDCGMRISDCGLENTAMLFNPHSAIRIPKFAK